MCMRGGSREGCVCVRGGSREGVCEGGIEGGCV